MEKGFTMERLEKMTLGELGEWVEARGRLNDLLAGKQEE